MMKCIIMDDEPLAHDILEGHITRHGQVELAAKCYTALQAFEVLHQEKIDLIFLDIRLPSINGIDFVKSLKSPPSIIFTTAFSEYALTGFEVDAVDYLLKPITYERFERSMQKLFRIHPAAQEDQKQYTYFKVSGKLIKIFHSELLFVQSVKDYLLLKTTTGSYLTHMTMKYISELLPAQTFSRVHRSYLVNKEHIDILDKVNLQIGSRQIPVGEHYKHNLEL